jgi:hypothetical protein
MLPRNDHAMLLHPQTLLDVHLEPQVRGGRNDVLVHHFLRQERGAGGWVEQPIAYASRCRSGRSTGCCRGVDADGQHQRGGELGMRPHVPIGLGQSR